MNWTTKFSICICIIFVAYCLNILGDSNGEECRDDQNFTCSAADGREAHEENCSCYYNCSNYNHTLRVCPERLFFNPAKNICDFQNNVPDCVGGTKPTTISTTTTEAPTTSNSICPPTGNWTYPYPGNCSLYIMCIEGNYNVFSCAVNLTFDKIDHWCKLDANCDAEEPTTENPGLFCPIEGVATFPHHSNCSKYYVCSNGLLYPQDCAPGTYYDISNPDPSNPNVFRCNIASEAECHAECPSEGTHYRAIREAGCYYFKVCTNGTAENYQCQTIPYALVWNDDKKGCVPPDTYTCPYDVASQIFD